MKSKKFNRTNKFFLLTLMFLASATFGLAQVASNPPYTIEQSVIAGGGGTSADGTGNQYSITGAIGQSVTDSSNASPYSIKSGFFTAAAPLAPTAGEVTVTGRVLTSTGRGIRNVLIMMTDGSGRTRTASTTAFGYFRFTDVAAGETYVFSARAKRYEFTQKSQVVSVSEDTSDIEFVALPVMGETRR